MNWCFTCDSKPITDGLGLEYREHSGCTGSKHDIGIMLRVDGKVLYEVDWENDKGTIKGTLVQVYPEVEE